VITEKDICQHRGEDWDFYIDGVVYACNCGKAFEVCDLINALDAADSEIEKLRARLLNLR